MITQSYDEREVEDEETSMLPRSTFELELKPNSYRGQSKGSAKFLNKSFAKLEVYLGKVCLCLNGRIRISTRCLMYVCLALAVIVCLVVAAVFSVYWENWVVRPGVRGLWRDASGRDCALDIRNCFDYRRCQDGRFSVYIYDTPGAAERAGKQYKLWLDSMRRRWNLTTDPNAACLLVPDIDTICDISKCLYSRSFKYIPTISSALRALPFWNNGKNHLLFEITDNSPLKYATDAAIVAKTSFDQATYRHDYDISIPLYARANATKAERRRPSSERPMRAFLKSIGSPHVRGVIRNACSTAPPELCTVIDNSDQSIDYAAGMANSKICIVPRGVGLHSYRLTEALKFGCVPLILADGFVLPFSEFLDWSTFSLRISEEDAASLPKILQTISDKHISKLQAKVIEVYEAHFDGPDQWMDGVMRVIQHRIQHYTSIVN